MLTALPDTYCIKLKKEVVWLAFHLICVSFYFYHWIEELGSFQGSLRLILTICIHWDEELSSSGFLSNLNSNVMISSWLAAAVFIAVRVAEFELGAREWEGLMKTVVSYLFMVQESE